MLFNIFGMLLFISIFFRIIRPKKINFLYGYRTTLSKSSQYHWDVAQRYSANLMILYNLLIFLLGSLFKLIYIPYEDVIITVLILVELIVVIFFTEKYLKKL